MPLPRMSARVCTASIIMSLAPRPSQRRDQRRLEGADDLAVELGDIERVVRAGGDAAERPPRSRGKASGIGRIAMPADASAANSATIVEIVFARLPNHQIAGSFADLRQLNRPATSPKPAPECRIRPPQFAVRPSATKP